MKTSTPKNSALLVPSPKSLPLIGNSALIEVAGIQSVPAKIDTGASYSSIWASDIQMLPSGELEFTLFAPKSPLYTGERLRTRRYRAVRVRNSTGQGRSGLVQPLEGLSTAEKEKVILQQGVPFLSLLWMRGHIMLYVGEWKGRPAIFHNVWGVRVINGDDDNDRFVIGRAVVTSITPGAELRNLYRKTTFADRLRSLTTLPPGKR